MKDDGPLMPTELDEALPRFFTSWEEGQKLFRELYDREAIQELVQMTRAVRTRIVAHRLFSKIATAPTMPILVAALRGFASRRRVGGT